MERKTAEEVIREYYKTVYRLAFARVGRREGENTERLVVLFEALQERVFLCAAV